MPDACVAFSDVATGQIIPVKNTFINFGDATGPPECLRSKSCPPSFKPGVASYEDIEWELCHAMALSTRFDFHAKTMQSSSKEDPNVSPETSEAYIIAMCTETQQEQVLLCVSPEYSEESSAASCKEVELEQAWPTWDHHMAWYHMGDTDQYGSMWSAYGAHVPCDMEQFGAEMGWPAWDQINTEPFWPFPEMDALSEVSTDVTDPGDLESVLTSIPSMKRTFGMQSPATLRSCDESTRGRDRVRATSENSSNLIVRNTFIDVDDPSGSPACLRAESCPPCHKPGAAYLDEIA